MSITRFVTADGLPAFLAHLSKSARVLAPVEKPGNKTAVVFEPWKEGKPFSYEHTRYATVLDGRMGLAFVDASIKSNAKEGAWEPVKLS